MDRFEGPWQAGVANGAEAAVLSPSDGKTLVGFVRNATATDVDAALDAARRTQPD
jgi:delta 1-pyrroline-5-carboxylate dehydrogenase